MKKVLNYIIVILSFIIILVSSYIYLNVEATPTSYYSESNKPVFYGLTYAEIKTGDTFNLLDTKNRIFATDFEDGDLTKNIKSTNDINTNIAGLYHINYEVTDSHNNKTTLTVSIKVIDNLENNYYERTLYSLPSVWNMNLAGTNRGNYHDSQMLGLYLKENGSISVKEIGTNHNLTLNFLNNDSQTEKKYTLSNNYQEITSTYSGVPFIKTVYDIKDTIKIGIRINNDNVLDLPYYHYLDNQDNFYQKWENNTNSYSVIESNYITLLVPYYDRDKLINYYTNSHSSLDSFLIYWQKVIDTFDSFLGLEINPDNALNQNVRTKYLVKANKNGYGSAYYAWDHVGIHSESVAPFFSMEWGSLHEIAHGYQGSLGNNLELEEVSNNILAYYVQTNKDIYIYNNNWLGKIEDIEQDINRLRKNGTTFKQLNLHDRLYVLINLLNTYDAQKTYAEINRLWREAKFNNEKITDEEVYVKAFYNLYKVNIIPYLESWGIDINNNIKEFTSNAILLTNPYDVTNDLTLSNEIKNIYNLKGIYSLIDYNKINNNSFTNDLNININIDSINELINKKIIIKGNNVYNEIPIESNNIIVTNLPIGIYEVILPTPINNNYSFEKYNYLIINKEQTSNLNANYTLDIENSLFNDNIIKLNGLGDQTFATIEFTNNNIIIDIKGNTPHSYYNDSLYASIKVYDPSNVLIYSKDFIGNQSLDKVTAKLKYQDGTRIEIYHDEAESRLITYSKLLNIIEDNLKVTNKNNVFITTKYGLYLNEDISYKNLLNKIDLYANQLMNNLSYIELNNKELFYLEKKELLSSILRLNNEDMNEFYAKYKYIFNGSTPKVEQIVTNLPSKEINYYSLIKVTDLEDGIINLNKNNCSIKDNGLLITYRIIDSDRNETIHTIEVIKEIPTTTTTTATNTTNTTTTQKIVVSSTNQSTTTKKKITTITTTKKSTTVTTKGEVIDSKVENKKNSLRMLIVVGAIIMFIVGSCMYLNYRNN